jgi:hypothetical protein
MSSAALNISRNRNNFFRRSGMAFETLQFLADRPKALNKRINWDEFGDVRSTVGPWDSGSGGVTHTTKSGVSLTIVSPGAHMLLISDQGDDKTNGLWQGNFAPGDIAIQVLSSSMMPPPIAIVFPTPVKGFATQIQPQGLPGVFNAVVHVSDGSTTGREFAYLGFSTNRADGGAIVVGAISDKAEIARIEFHTLDPDQVAHPCAINQMFVKL